MFRQRALYSSFPMGYLSLFGKLDDALFILIKFSLIKLSYSDWDIRSYFPAFISALPALSHGPSHVPRALQSFLSLLVTINGALNPVIYVLKSNEFKMAFRNFWRSARHMVISYIRCSARNRVEPRGTC